MLGVYSVEIINFALLPCPASLPNWVFDFLSARGDFLFFGWKLTLLTFVRSCTPFQLDILHTMGFAPDR